MGSYRSYTHLERYGRDEVEGILNGHIVVQPKLDGSNAVVYSNMGEIYCGSRTRELAAQRDNAGFREYILNSDEEDVVWLRKFLESNPQYMVYGEWLGCVAPYSGKFIGSIKSYLEGGFFIFDVFDISNATYLPYNEWISLIGDNYKRVVPVLAEFDNPSIDEIMPILDSNHFNLPESVLGEGVVIKREPCFRDAYGNIQIAKIVRDEYKQDKAKPKKVYTEGEIEQEYVDNYVTEAYLDKCKNKVVQACGADSFDCRNKKHMGMMMTLAVKDSIEEDIGDFIKKKRYPIINFNVLKNLITAKARDFLVV